MQVTVTSLSPWLFMEATETTPEQKVIDKMAPDMVGKFGFCADYDFRPTLGSSNVVKKGLAIQANPLIVRDWLEGYADYEARKAVH